LIGAIHECGYLRANRKIRGGNQGRGILLGVKPHTEDDAQVIERQWKAIGAERLQT
jgi:hypothetical protein